jgi:phosphoribosylformimino-5-aminoimidazole carboxamide ribonucleotide (ProFAR) isomerase
MKEDMTFFVGGACYCVITEVEREGNKVFVSAEAMREVNREIAARMLTSGGPLTREKYKFLKDVTGVSLKDLVDVMLTLGKTDDLRAAFMSELSSACAVDAKRLEARC